MEGGISGIKKRLEESHASVERSHNKATLSPVQYCHSVEGIMNDPVAAAFFVFICIVLFANSLLRHSYCFVYLSSFRAVYILLGFCA